MGVFKFADGVIEYQANESLTTQYTLTGREEFLQDHFADFPVMPGVLMLESLKQAAVLFLSKQQKNSVLYQLARVEDAKFGQFVKPGSEISVSVRFLKTENAHHYFDGRIEWVCGPEGPTKKRVLSARFSLKEL